MKNLRRKKVNRYEKQAQRREHLKTTLQGKGMYIFENISKGDLWLPKPAEDGSKGPIPPGKQWQGDSYFMQLVQNHDAKIVKILISPQEQLQEQKMDKLLVDQPDRVTVEGEVEHVMATEDTPLNEESPIVQSTTKKRDILINEDPLHGVTIIQD